MVPVLGVSVEGRTRVIRHEGKEIQRTSCVSWELWLLSQPWSQMTSGPILSLTSSSPLFLVCFSLSSSLSFPPTPSPSYLPLFVYINVIITATSIYCHRYCVGTMMKTLAVWMSVVDSDSGSSWRAKGSQPCFEPINLVVSFLCGGFEGWTNGRVASWLFSVRSSGFTFLFPSEAPCAWLATQQTLNKYL